MQELYEQKIEGVTVSSVIGKGGLGFIEANGEIDLDEKVRLDIALSNDNYKGIAKEAIRSSTQDHGNGAGKMWVIPILEVKRIRTGEKNEAALTQSNRKSRKNHNESYFKLASPSPLSLFLKSLSDTICICLH